MAEPRFAEEAEVGLSAEQLELLDLMLAEEEVDESRAESVPRRADRAELPLSFAQERMWFLDQLEPGSAAYNVPSAVRLSGRLDVSALLRGLAEVARRHESLRVCFAGVAGRPVLRRLATLAVALPRIDLRRLPPSPREAEVRRRVSVEARTPFDIGRGPLWRAALVELGGDERLLLLTLHHVVSDGWSMEVLIRELAALYRAFAGGRGSPLPEPPIQYADFAAWQRRWLTGEVLETQLAFWKEQLAGAPTTLELPGDRPRPALQSFRGAVRRFACSAAVSAALAALGRRQGASLFMTLLAAFQSLLGRLSGSRDFLLGTPIANRNRPEIEGLIGFFVNTLVVRASPREGLTFRRLLEQVRARTLAAYAHQDLPFERLVEVLHPARDQSRTPLFQVMFVLNSSRFAELELPGLTLTPVDLDTGTAKFDLLLSMSESRGEPLTGSLEFATDLFDRATIARFVTHFQTLLAGVAAAPDSPLEALPLLTPGERFQLLVEWNDTGREAARHCLHELVAAQAARTPEAVAVDRGGACLSYRELVERAGRLGGRLRSLGVGPDARVGVCCERSPEIVTGLLGVLMAGGAYVPLDPEYPAQRLAFMLEDAAVEVLLTQERLRDRLPVLSRVSRVLCLDTVGEEGTLARPCPYGGGESAGDPDALAYVIYTSGSTGRPKGVAIAHRSAAALLAWAGRVYPGERLRHVLASTSICFDLSIFELFLPLSRGGRVVLADNALSLSSMPQAARVTLINTVPSAMAELVRLGAVPRSSGVVNLAGEPLRRQLADAIYGTGVEEVWNLYGPSEDTTYSTFTRVDRDGGREPHVGRPVGGSRLYVLDRALRPVPVGVVGELHMAGQGLARGYLDRPGLTAERFLPDAAATEPGGRAYRTGDLARFLPDGNVGFLGRIDHQVKVRGFRIELGEVEAVLGRHPAVRDAAVLALADAAGGPRLVAYVVLEGDGGALRGFLRERLPEYMVPATIVELEEMPLTPNRKVDRAALARQTPAAVSAAAFVAPRTAVEEVLAGIWAEVLGARDVPRIGADDDFFDIGGHSLLATRVLARVRDAFGVELPVHRLFAAPRLSELAAAVEEARRSTPRPAAPRLARVEREGPMPLSFAQQRLWFLAQLEPDNPEYNMPMALAVGGHLEVAALRRALDALARRHETLRTRFAEVEGSPVQIVDAEPAVRLLTVDLRRLPAQRREAETARLTAAEARRPFDLARGPLFRVHLLALGTGEHVLLFNQHHVVSDGWSAGIFVREMGAFYQAFAAGRDPGLAELPVQYADFACWQRQWLRGEVLESQLAYWRRQLAGLPAALDLPTDRPRPAVRAARGAQRPVALPPDLARSLETLSREHGATLFMTLLAAFATLLHRYSGQRDLAVGSPIAGRRWAEVEGLIGFFVNTLVLRADLAGDPPFRELLGRVRETALAAYAHQDVPFEQLVEELEPRRDRGRTPLFQVALALQNAPVAPLELPELTLSPLPADSGTAKFDLTLSLTPELESFVEYDTDLWDATTVDRLAAHLRVLLEAAAACPLAPISTLGLTSPAERHQLLTEWNDTESGYPRDACVHDVFAGQARRRPDAVALVCGAAALTYRELDRRADALAHDLRRRGVGPETLVPLVMERCPELVIGILGVLKAGAAYLPLDPSYPRRRLELLIAESRSPVVLDRETVGHERTNDDSGVTSRPEGLCYVMYTSGTTGVPKGVAVPHRAVLRLVREAGFADLGERQTFLQLASVSFDAATLEIWGPLANGGKLVLFDGRAPSLEELAACLVRERVTTLWLTAGLFHQMVEANLAGLAPLHQLLTGGDVLSPSHVRRLLSELPGCRLVNGYGPTENTTFTCCAPLAGPAPAAASVPIGRPIAASRVHLLDGGLRPVPAGVAGMLHTGGDGLARGYFARPALTAAAFIPDPLSRAPGERLYRTGDLARHLADGRVAFLGRRDAQVKVRGFRIEPGEIEAALARHPAVAQAVVLARDAADGKQLVAFLVAAGAPPDTAELRRHLEETLPRYMVPAAVVVLDAFPLTPNGKVDRAALGRHALPDAGARASAAPRTPAEEVLCGIWAQVLEEERVGVDDDFFELGGHSLLATRLISRVRGAFGASLPLACLFDAPTPRAFAELLAAPAEDETVPPLAADPEGRTEASFAQERLWFLDRLDPGSPAYNMPAAVRLRGALDPGRLERGLDEVTRRHQVLRTTFRQVDGRPVPEAAERLALPVPLVDLAGLAPDRREREAARLEAAEELRSFDLGAGPLLRVLLLRLAPEEHLFVLNVHHVIADGWSFGVLVRELGTLYEAYATGRPADLPELPVQYADFARWQRRRLQGEARERQLAWWRERLGGELPVLDLPLDRPRPAVQTYRGGRRSLTLPRELADGLRALSRGHGATLFMTLLATFKVLLHRLSGQDDVVVGFPIAGRNQPEVEGLIGLFLNTLALRTRLTAEATFREVLARVRESALGAYAHQDVPFELLLEELRPERDLSRTPVFQVLFNMLNFPRHELRLPGLTLELGSQVELPSKFDLTLYVAESGGEIGLDLVYNADLFDGERIEEMLEQYRGLLTRVAADPDETIGRLSLVTPRAAALLPDPRRALAVAWPGALHERVLARARAAPGRAAAVDEDETWTYGELAAAAETLALRLAAAGIGPGDVVALHARRAAALAPAVVGVLASGAAFLILDPAYPPARTLAIVRQARPRGWLRIPGAPACAELEAALAAECRRFEPPPKTAAPPDERPASRVTPEDPAYVAFTSGSTGVPKGIVGGHGPVSHFLDWHAATFGLTAEDRFSMLSGLAHDPLLRDLFTPLWLGATLVVPDADEMGTPGWLAAWVRRRQVSVAHLTPAMGRLLVEGESAELPSLRYLFFGAEALARQDLAQVRRIAPRAACVAFYGATETPQAMGFFRVPDAFDRPTVPVGRGIADVQLLVTNAAGALAGIGERGEIAIRTPYLAAGYLNDPELTRARFPANPWTSEGGDRLYRTGDLGRYLPSGDVEFLGRADQQVKIRGFRVELAEIEAALGAHPAVAAAVVLLRDDASGLTAYVVARPGRTAPAREELSAHLRERLPDYMVPRAFVTLDALPLSPSGKVDRRALPAPERRSYEAAGDASPRSPVEEVVAGIFAELLALDRVPSDADFFDLGGHSLLATRALARLRAVLGVELSVRQLFAAPTPAGLAAEVEAARRRHQGVETPPIRPAERDGPLPLSFSQERLWFLANLETESAAYNMPSALRLTGSLDVDALDRALAEIVRRHEALRTTFHAVEGRPVQRIAPAAGSPLARVDLRALAADTRRAEARRLIARETRRPFRLDRGPLLRTLLLELDAAVYAALVVMHHVVSDGWSLGVFVREMAALYGACLRGEPASEALPPLPVQYADFAVWQRRRLGEEVLGAQLDFWRRQLADAPAALDLPTDRPRPAVWTGRGARLEFDFPGGLVGPLRAVGRAHGATLFMTLLAGFQALLYRATGQRDVLVGTPVAGRGRLEVEGLIGVFVNTLVLRGDPSGTSTFAELLERTRRTALAAYAHQDLPFERLVEELQPRRDLTRTPFFQVMLVLQNAPPSALELPGLTIEPVAGDAGTARFDLLLTAAEIPDGLAGALEYSTDLFDPTTVRRLVDHYVTLLAGAAARPEQRVGALPLLGAGERHQLLREWNDSRVAWPPAPGLHQLVEEQVARAPDAVALVYEDRRLSYRALDARADALARRLGELGVGPDILVGICAERSLELVVGLLAILKAGGAYVPLDPTYPRERLAFMTEDAGAPVLLTQEHLRDVLPEHSATTVTLDAGVPTTPARPPWRGTPDSLAYAIFTSGSTGRPKGAMNSHRAIVNRLLWMQAAYGLTPEDRVLQKTPFSFDVSVWELFWPLMVGARLVVARPGGHQDAAYLVRLIVREGITTLHFVPSMLQVFLEQPGAQSCHSLRRVIASGEALPYELEQRFFARLGAELHNLYGPTEAAVDVTYQPCAPSPRRRPVAIGRPVANTAVHVFDRDLRPAPIGGHGELHVGGVQLARGYLGRGGLTAERFIPDPLSEEPGGRLYKTGDLSRHLAGGAVEYLGRLDFQVKLRGQRIELGEIEATLAAHPSVREAVVLCRDDGGDPRLVAYLVPRAGASCEPPALRAFLEERLPEHMVPALFVELESLPLNPNGKADRKALGRLPLPGGEGRREGAFAAPRDVLELRLARIWEEVLGVASVGVRDDFFALGGHSLSAVRLLARIEQEQGRQLPLAAFFRAPTVEQLARLLRQHESPSAASLVAIRTGGTRAPLFCVHPAGGNVLSFVALADALGPDQPLYALQSRGLEGGEEPLTRVEEMAARYLAEVRAAVPHGPYNLAGWSFGGLVAFEMARQLRRQGEEVALLALLDTRAPGTGEGPAEDVFDDDAFWLADVAGFLSRLAGRESAVTYEELRQAAPAAQVGLFVTRLQEIDFLPPGAGEDQVRRLLRVYKANVRAAAAYEGGPYPGRVTVLRAAAEERQDEALGWQRFSPEPVEVHDVPGDHVTVLARDNVPALAQRLGDCL